MFADSCTVAAAIVGIGFLSGKEAQVFCGDYPNAAVFALCFFSAVWILRKFCFEFHCRDTAEFAQNCFDKYASFFLVVLCLCNFVCAVSALAGLQNCFEQAVSQTKFPVYAFVAAVISAHVLKAKQKAFKILNVISIILALGYLTAAAICAEGNIDAKVNTNLFQTAVYAIFSAFVTLGILVPLSDNDRRNFSATLVAASLLCALICLIISEADFSLSIPIKPQNSCLGILGAVTFLLATVTGVVANVLPIVQYVDTVIQDETLSTLCVLCLAVTLSMFGFDFVLKYGYVSVAAAGAVTISAAGAKLINRHRTATRLSAKPPHRHQGSSFHRNRQKNFHRF